MCTRLNNIHSLLDLLKPIERYAKRACDVNCQHGAGQPNHASVNEDGMQHHVFFYLFFVSCAP